MPLKALLPLVFLCVRAAASQGAAFPLESVATEGSSIPQAVILEIAGLRLAAPIDKPGIEQACSKLQESGLFASVSYRYAPGPKKGYAVTLLLEDQAPLVPATIDVPGADEDEAWRWLSSKYKRFDRAAPQAEAGQRFLAAQLERHIGSRMRGQHMVVRIETDLTTQTLTLSFQPETLPRVQSVAFTGNQALTSAELASVMSKVLPTLDYTDRKFASAIDLNLRRAYEERGFYRVRFAPGAPQLSEAGVSLSVAIEEGAFYQLGKVEIVGDSLPVEAMLSSAKLPTGKVANWKQIQDCIWEMERVVKRTGFMETTASPVRSYDDASRVLNLRIEVNKGPLYRFGEIRISGLSPDLHERAKRFWKPKTGDPYDYAYPNEFFQAFSRTVDFRTFRKYDSVARKGAGDHVIDINVVFESR